MARRTWLPEEPTVRLEVWKSQSHPLTSGGGGESADGVQSPEPGDLISQAYVM